MPASRATDQTGLRGLMSRAADQIVLQGAALRHAQAAMATGRTAEAVVVLDAAINGDHLTLKTLDALVEAKTEELLDAANMEDAKTLLAAFLRHQDKLEQNTPVRKK